MSAKYFLGLGMDQPAPDHSTLTNFKERMLQRQRMLKLEQLLADIVKTALRKGVRFGSIQVVDSTHKKDSHKQIWLALQSNPTYRIGSGGRYKIEGKFG